MLKTKIIPPVCPKCPDCTLIQRSSNAINEKIKDASKPKVDLKTQTNPLDNVSSVNVNNNQKKVMIVVIC